MPTIDQLAPATAATDADELIVSQNTIARKITRAQILAGVQTQLAIPGGTLLGRATSGFGGPEMVAIGNYLTLVSGTLSAVAAPYSISLSPAGLVPSVEDFVPIGQGGGNAAISYSVFMQGLSSVANVDGSRLLVSATGSTARVTMSELASSVITKPGGSLTGPLILASDPATPLQAATRQYADARLARSGDTLTGPLQLAGDPGAPLQAATKRYVDSQSVFPRFGFTMAGQIVLAADPILSTNPATKSYADQKLSRSGDTLTGQLGLASDPASPFHAATKNYVDTQIATSVPLNGGSMSGPLSLFADPIIALQPATKRYADTKLSRSGDSLSGPLTLAGDPSGPLIAATKNYVDAKGLLALARSGGTMTGPLSLGGDPTSPSHAATKYYVDAGVSSALPVAGGTVTGPIVLAVNPAAPAHAANKQYVDSQLSAVLPLTGGTLSGFLNLISPPTAPLHAATKQYVDANPDRAGVINVRLPPCNAKLDGRTDDTAAFIAAYQLTPAGGTIYVPNGSTVLQSSSTWGLPTTKRVKWIIDGTTLPDGSPLADAIPGGTGISPVTLPSTVSGLGSTGMAISQATSQPTDFAVTHTSYVVNHAGGGTQSVLSNSRTDTIVTQSPSNHVWSGYDRLVWSGTQTPVIPGPSKHISRYIQAVRQTVGTDAGGRPLPQPQMWSGYVEYRDTTGKPSSWTNASVSMEIDWIGNGADDASQRQLQALVLGQHDPAGTPVEISTGIGISLASGSIGKVYRVLNVSVPYAISVLDTTGATQLTGAAAIRLAAGQSIAFEATNAVNLTYSSTSGAIIAKYAATSCAIGRGISVAFGVVFSASATLAPSAAGSIVFLVGGGSYAITLPPANTLMAGTGFTFSALGSGTVSIVPANGETVELMPVSLRQFDRYHIISDGTSIWREIFRGNSVSTRFSNPPILPSYTVAGLPQSPGAGAKAFATNGRKPNDLSGAGTGVEVFFDGAQWISVCGGLQVAV